MSNGFERGVVAWLTLLDPVFATLVYSWDLPLNLLRVSCDFCIFGLKIRLLEPGLYLCFLGFRSRQIFDQRGISLGFRRIACCFLLGC